MALCPQEKGEADVVVGDAVGTSEEEGERTAGLGVAAAGLEGRGGGGGSAMPGGILEKQDMNSVMLFFSANIGSKRSGEA